MLVTFVWDVRPDSLIRQLFVKLCISQAGNFPKEPSPSRYPLWHQITDKFQDLQKTTSDEK